MQTRLSLRLGDNERMELGKAIQSARKKLRMSQSELGRLLNVSKAAVSQWESGKNMPDPRKLPDLLRVLNLDPRVAIGSVEIGNNAHLLSPKEQETFTTAASDVRRDNSAPALPSRTEMRRIIPILGVVVGGSAGDFTMNDGTPIAFALETPGIEGRRDVFALYVQNESMSPWREPGQLVYVDTHQRPKITDYVVVEMHPAPGTAERPAYLKRWVGRSGNMIRLEQFNPPKVFSVDQRKIHKVYKVIDWSELLA